MYENLKWKVLFALWLLATSLADSLENLFMVEQALVQFKFQSSAI